MLFGVSALLAAMLLLTFDHYLQANGGTFFFLYGGTPEGARNVLSTIAQSMLTFTGLVFTVTMLVLQQASSQLSPRVLRTFLADRQNQVVLGLFVSTFVYTLVVLLDVRAAGSGTSFVPGLSVWISFLLLGAAVIAFVYYINHMAHSLRASTVIANIAADTVASIERTYPTRPDGPVDDPTTAERLDKLRESLEWRIVDAPQAGTLTDFDPGGMLRIAQAAGVVVELLAAVGDFVPSGTPLMRVGTEQEPTAGEALDSELLTAIAIGRERTMHRDPAFGFRQLVDVASRALSPGVNDPTTAAQALDRLHDLLLRLVERPLPSPIYTADDDSARLIVHHRSWAYYVRLAVEEPRLYGAAHVQVVERLRRLLVSLVEHAPADRVGVVRVELNLVEAAIAKLRPELNKPGAYREETSAR